MPAVSKIKRYTTNDIIDVARLSRKCEEVTGKKPFHWQLKAATEILRGNDVVLDVGTGSGKTICFSLPLLLGVYDTALIISPLSALMIDQVANDPLRSVAVCQENMAKVGKEQMYKDIVNGKFCRVLVSPEIARSKEFGDAVLCKAKFNQILRVVVVDEAHCISEWGGSFRTDYADLGLVRGRLKADVPWLVASATLPSHVLDDIRTTLKISSSAAYVRMTNARPNVALSTRVMKFGEESKGDLRFTIPFGATKAEDIPIQLIYCNSRLDGEDIVDRLRFWLPSSIPQECIQFYHAKKGTKEKRSLEERLAKGEVRILVCTDAVGMGCDMRNIERVSLWGLPPSFCSLVQRAGRAARDFSKVGEAILIVTPAVKKSGLQDGEFEATIERVNEEREAENMNDDAVEEAVVEALQSEGIQVADGRQELIVEEGGVRREQAAEAENEVDVEHEASKKKKKKKRAECNSREARYLSKFASTTHCLRAVWDEFFDNRVKVQLNYPLNTTYQPKPHTRCCNNCEPDKFPVEIITMDKVPGLRRGRKKEVDKLLVKMVRQSLEEWREGELLDKLYPNTTSITPDSIMSDTVVEQLSTAGRVTQKKELERTTRWVLAYADRDLSDIGRELLIRLADIYEAYDAEHL
ncbi:P-loop containing nucleoside triphosphate hydrolase protein [Rickenella mellea]|uniref:DNA 3'-5' helicase n=1 Tax=Rickenella mellea TaxID=50990 RepID=A0A4Y7QKS7_9AGAM|nr:P-loop containing nucleoside triphosphate hydrolase protein [Rickenella mellea]